MSAGLLDHPRSLFDRTGAAVERRGEAGLARARVTLEERLDTAWRVLQNAGAADCPVCEGQMTVPHAGRAARCGSCGSRLS